MAGFLAASARPGQHAGPGPSQSVLTKPRQGPQPRLTGEPRALLTSLPHSFSRVGLPGLSLGLCLLDTKEGWLHTGLVWASQSPGPLPEHLQKHL